MSVSILETVRAALEKDDRQYFQDIDADLKKRIDDTPKQTIWDLLISLTNTSFFLAQNFTAESYILKHAQHKTKEICKA